MDPIIAGLIGAGVMYGVTGLFYGIGMASADMGRGEPADEIVWIPIGILFWPYFAVKMFQAK